MPEALNGDLIHRALSGALRQRLDRLEVFDEVGSTNSWLMERHDHRPGRFQVALADHQTAGRGRHDRPWVSPAGAGLWLSVAYTFPRAPNHLSCVTLAVGVAVAEALHELGATGVRLKWPNDLYANDAKLGGILTDAQAIASGSITLVCGLGLNLRLPEAVRGRLDCAATDLASHTAELPGRSALAARMIEALAGALQQFEEQGFARFREAWQRYDWLRGQRVQVDMPDSYLTGVADGIDDYGALRVLTEQGPRRIFTGTVRRITERAVGA